MKRREFVQKSALAGLTTFAIPGLLARAIQANPQVSVADIAEVHGSNPEAMASAGIAALGGLSQFLKHGQKVLVKPTIAFDATPESGWNTDPLLVMRVVRECQKAGAAQVYVFDNSIDDWRKSYKSSGIERALKVAMSKIIPANDPAQHVDAKKFGYVGLDNVKLHQQLSECDVLINIPAFGIMPDGSVLDSFRNLSGLFLNRANGGNKSVDEILLDFLQYRKPQLTVIDGLRIADRKLRTVSSSNTILLSRDFVAADVFAYTKFLPEYPLPEYLVQAANRNFGTTHTENLSVEKIYI